MIIMPRSPSLSGEVDGAVEAMCGSTWRIKSIVPRTLTESTKSKSEREKGVRSRDRIYGGVRVWVEGVSFEVDWRGGNENVTMALLF